jgi:hypothetical protein
VTEFDRIVAEGRRMSTTLRLMGKTDAADHLDSVMATMRDSDPHDAEYEELAKLFAGTIERCVEALDGDPFDRIQMARAVAGKLIDRAVAIAGLDRHSAYVAFATALVTEANIGVVEVDFGR